MLKPDRHIFQTEINLSFNGTAEAGTVMVYNAPGSGAAIPDETAGTLSVGPGSPSGAKVAGLLVHPFVAFNPLLHRNWYKVTQYPGEKATLLRQGWVTTNVVATGAVPDAGKSAYLGANGVVHDAGPGPKIGEFMSRLDENGYCRLAVHLP